MTKGALSTMTAKYRVTRVMPEPDQSISVSTFLGRIGEQADNPACQGFLDLPVSWNWLCHPGHWIPVPIVPAPVSDQLTPKPLDLLYQIDTLHVMISSPTFRMPGI